MHRAFILSRPYDLTMARRCAARLTRQGWLPLILLDPREWLDFPADCQPVPYWTRGAGMFGTFCAMAISQGILDNSAAGDIVAKFDCDVALTNAAAAWLAGATATARCFPLGGTACGTLWAAPRAQVSGALEWLAASRPCRCPESSLHIKALRRSGGMETHPTLSITKWIPPRPWPPDAGALTLPTVCRVAPRLTCGLAMMETPAPN